MSGLFGTMSIALGALQAQQAGMQATTNNLANLNTPGYSRQVPVLQEADPVVQGSIAFGGGVDLEGIQSLRDNLLDLQISDETQQQGNSQAYVDAMNQVQTLFPDDTTGIGAQISAFFQSLNSLATNPSDLTTRQSVLSAATGMTSAFNDTANQINTESTQLNSDVQQQVQQVNQISQQIAAINVQLASVSSSGQDAGTFLDQRGALIQQLSGIIDVSQISDGSSLTLTTKQGAALVVDGQAYALSTSADPTGVQQIYSAQGNNITGQISGGRAGRPFASPGPDLARAAGPIGLSGRRDGAGVECSESGRHGFEWRPGRQSFQSHHRSRGGSRHVGCYYRSCPHSRRIRWNQRQQW